DLSTNDAEVEHRRAQHAHEPDPERQEHLGTASGADVAQVYDVPPAEPLAQPAHHALLRVRIVTAHEQVVIAVTHCCRLDHQPRRHRVQRLHYPRLREGALNL